jgi:iron complex outermembrane receptor protein
MNGHRALLPIAFAAAPFLFSPPSAAQELADLPLEALMRIEVVSASRKPQHLADVPASMHVITAEDIRSSGARNLPEALRLVPGVDVAQLSSSRWAVSTRGFTGRYANKLLVLIDGRSIYSPMFSGVLWEAERVPLDSIDRIEVLHGPAGSIWGSNAVNGVINIITRAASETQGNAIDVSIGDGGRQAAYARHGGASGAQSQWRLGVLGERGASSREIGGEDANDAYRLGQLDARWDGHWDDRSHSTVELQWLRTTSNERQTQALYVPPYISTIPVELSYERGVLTGRHETAVSATLDVSFAGWLVSERIRFSQRMSTTPTLGTTEVNARWRGIEGHEWSFGAGLRHLDIPAEGSTGWAQFVPERRQGLEWSLYAQDDWTLVPGRWRLTGGLRVDHDLYTGSHTQPNLRLLHTPNEALALWAALSRASRTPARGEQDGIFQVALLPPGSAANPGPLPVVVLSGNGLPGSRQADHQLDAFEIGLRAQPLPLLSLNVAAFRNRLQDTAASGVISAQTPVFVATPSPHLEVGSLLTPYSVTLQGLEFELDWRPATGWRHQLGLSHFEAGVPSNTTVNGVDHSLYATPRWIGFWRSVVDLAAGWRLDLRVRHAGARGAPDDATRHTDAYTALDATLTWRTGSSSELALGGTNLLRPAVVEFSPDYGLATATTVAPRVFARWRQSF